MKKPMQLAPLPPFDRVTALAKVRLAEDAWNSRDPRQVIDALSPECVWRSRADLFQGRPAIQYLLEKTWAVQMHSQLANELWTYTKNRMSVRFECEWQHLKTGQWYRSYGNEHWAFDANGYMTHRAMNANDVPITASQRRIQ